MYGRGVPWTCSDLDTHIRTCFARHAQRRRDIVWCNEADLAFQCPICGDLFFYIDNSCRPGKHALVTCEGRARPDPKPLTAA